MNIYNAKTRINYNSKNSKLNDNPFSNTKIWLKDEESLGNKEPNACNLSTIKKVNDEFYPDSRIVLIKYIDNEGFYFFTNYKSSKANQIELNNNACLNFFLYKTERQIKVRGKVEKCTENISNNYFKTRPLKSKIASFASKQSQIVTEENELLNRFKYFENFFTNKDIERPSFWGGYILKPKSFEFWQGGLDRMHKRNLFLLNKDKSFKSLELFP